MVFYDTSKTPSIGNIGLASSNSANYSSGSTKASDDGTHMPEYPSTVTVGGSSDGGYTESKKVKASDDGTHMPEYPSSVEVSGGGYSDGHVQPKKEQDTPTTPESTPQPQGTFDVKKLLENQTPPSTFYVDDEGNISNTKDTKDNVYYGNNALTPKSFAPKNPKAQKTTTENQYRSGDDYILDDSYFANAQLDTGNNKVANSIVGGGGGGSKDNSVDNHNDAIFGGEKQKATPGKSLLPERILF